MPKATLVCELCGRDRVLSQLNMKIDVDLDLPRFVAQYECKNGCQPTRWEAWREQRKQRKLVSDLKRWTKQ